MAIDKELLIRAGKIRSWGVSNYGGWQVAKTVLTAKMLGATLPVAHQLNYTPEAREVEYEIIPAGRDLGVATQIWSPLGEGLLTGKIDRNVQGKSGPIVEMEEAGFDELLAINLKGPWLMTRAALRVMIPAKTGGAIVNTSSFLSTAATVGMSGYSASKAGLDAMIRAIALEVGPHGIRINNINPGVIDTPMLRAHGDEIIPPLAARAALKRLGTPEDIADVAVWLCSDGARFATGQSLLIDGGFTIPGPH